MKKSTSLMLGILSTVTWITMVILLVLTNIGLQTFMHGAQSNLEGMGLILLIALFGWLFWGLAVIFVMVYAIGIPHFFLYVYDKHRTTYMYLVKYLSVIPIFFLLVYGYFTANTNQGTNMSFLSWFRFGWPVILIIPLTMIVLLTRHIPYKKRG